MTVDPNIPRHPAASFAPDPAAVVARLEQLRASVRRGLDRIEALARQRLATPASAAEFEPRLRELEQARAELEADAERWERQRAAQIADLEHERRRLAEAWERLERDRLEGSSAPRAAAIPVPIPGPESIARPPAPLEPAGAEFEGPISRAILHQFEALRRDVRRHAEGRQRG